MFLSYLELSLSDCAPLVTEVPGSSITQDVKAVSYVIYILDLSGWKFITVPFKCLLLVHFLQHTHTHTKRSSEFYLITPLTHLCRLPNTEWYVHMCFKILFPASTLVLLCYILIICCISETQSVFFRSPAKPPRFPLTHSITADFSMNIQVKQLVPY